MNLPSTFLLVRNACRCFSVVALLAFAGQEAFAAEPAHDTSLEAIVSTVLARNPELQSYAAEVDAMRGQRRQVGAWKNPEVTVSGGQRKVYDYGQGVNNQGYTFDVSLQQTFEFPGKGTLRKAVADRNVQLAQLGLEQFQLSLAGQVRHLAFKHKLASQSLAVAETVQGRSTELINLLKNRQAAGSAPYLEMRVLQGALVELRQNMAELAQEREESRIQLNSLLGQPSEQALPLNFNPKLPSKIPAVREVVNAGLMHNLQLRMRLMELERAQDEISVARLAVAPDFQIGPFFSRQDARQGEAGAKTGEKETNVGLSLTMALPLWNQNQGNVATARARETQAEALTAEARRKIEAEIAARLRSYQIARAQYEEAPLETLEQLQAAAELADRQYRQGVIPVQLFLEVQRSWINAQRGYYNALQRGWDNLLDLQLLTGGSVTFTP